MKKIKDCAVENCIPSPSSCTEWNGGDIEALGICNGDSLNNVVWEIATKLKEIAGEDLSSFDIDSLLDICLQKAPLEVNLLSILTVLKNNDICIKEYIDILSDRISELSLAQGVHVDLKCYADFDNLGNALAITRDQLDQLVINNLCAQKNRIDSLEGSVTLLQNEIDNIDANSVVDELSFPTCVNEDILPTSTQVINVADAHCDLEGATGDSVDITAALSQTPGDLTAEFGLIAGWVTTPTNWAENYGNLLLEVENLRQRIKTMETTCCATSCDDLTLGFTVVFNESKDGLLIRFTSGAGTSIPTGFVDKGSTGKITDGDGNVVTFNIDIVDNFLNSNETDASIVGLSTTSSLKLEITSRIGNDTNTCESCLTRTVSTLGICDFCTVCASGTTGTVVLIYDDTGGAMAFESFNPESTTTTTTAP